MKILISGICGFVGSTLAKDILNYKTNIEIIGFDNFSRKGSKINYDVLVKLGITIFDIDLRDKFSVLKLPPCNYVIDAAANSSVTSGLDSDSASFDLVDNNLFGTVNLLEYCKLYKSVFILLSTSRVYSITELSKIKLVVKNEAFVIDDKFDLPLGVTSKGINEKFSNKSPLSIYGATKLTSEIIALEYGEAFSFPVFINRCGVLAGAGQFGKPDQGIYSFWINSWINNRTIKFIGFNGSGYQVRDLLHPKDLTPVIIKQFDSTGIYNENRICNFSGGISSAISLKQLSNWCESKFGKRDVLSCDDKRVYDVPFLVLDSSKASIQWNWQPTTKNIDILDEIAEHSLQNPLWHTISND